MSITPFRGGQYTVSIAQQAKKNKQFATPQWENSISFFPLLDNGSLVEYPMNNKPMYGTVQHSLEHPEWKKPRKPMLCACWSGMA